MKRSLTRRGFLAGSAAAGIAFVGAGKAAAGANDPQFKTTLHKAMIRGLPKEKTPGKLDNFERMLQGLKDAGFEGIECGSADVAPDHAAKARAVAEKLGMRIHSVLRGWMAFNSNKPSAVEGSIKSVERALRAAKGYGADAVLVVPCRVGGRMPKPWEFDYEIDPKTCHVSRVAKGDNAPYQQYIEAQNRSTDMAREALKKCIPAAEKTGVVIAIENVWNNLWVKPGLFAAFIRSCDSPWVQAYFDIGNHVRYALPELWIRELGKLIVKCHVKDFKLNANGQGGKWARIGEGSVDWPLVRRELDKVGYNGWLSNESGGFSLQEFGRRFDLIIAGKPLGPPPKA